MRNKGKFSVLYLEKEQRACQPRPLSAGYPLLLLLLLRVSIYPYYERAAIGFILLFFLSHFR